MQETKIGFDTGFFIKALQGDRTAVDVWKTVLDNKSAGIISCLTIFEINRLMLKGAIDRISSEILLNDICNSCHIVWVDEIDILESSAKISHSNNIPAIDSLIISSLIKSGVTVIYSTDTHVCSYKKKNVAIIKLG